MNVDDDESGFKPEPGIDVIIAANIQQYSNLGCICKDSRFISADFVLICQK
jgi:hypothetical protein